MNIINYLIENNGKPVDITWLELAVEFNIKPNKDDKTRAKAANDIWRTYLRKGDRKDFKSNVDKMENNEFKALGVSSNIDNGTINIDTYYKNPPTPGQIINDHKIDTSKYKLVNYYSKAKNNGWHVTANFKSLDVQERVQTKFIDFLKTYNFSKQSKSYNSLDDLNFKSRVKDSNMLEISIPDLHIDKRGLENQSFDELANLYLGLIKELVLRATKSFTIEKIVFVAGNDFFNTDNIHNATASHMNVQEINETWYNSYTKGFDILVKVIDFLRNEIPNVHIISLPGNHGKSKEFYLVHALSAFFRNVDGITFDIGAQPRKLLVYGDTSIMYHHGNCKLEALPTIMAQEFRKEWGETKYKRIHTGDKHHFMEKEINGVLIKQFPSLSQTDTWHNENNYILNQRKALVLVHNYTEGLVATFEKGI